MPRNTLLLAQSGSAVQIGVGSFHARGVVGKECGHNIRVFLGILLAHHGHAGDELRIRDLVPFLGQVEGHTPVSYTHLDVYKRQVLRDFIQVCSPKEYIEIKHKYDLLEEMAQTMTCLLYTSILQ